MLWGRAPSKDIALNVCCGKLTQGLCLNGILRRGVVKCRASSFRRFYAISGGVLSFYNQTMLD